MEPKRFKVRVEILDWDGEVYAEGGIWYKGLFADTAMQRAFITHDRLYGFGGKHDRYHKQLH